MINNPTSAFNAYLTADGCLSEKAESDILDQASKLACECPKHLVMLLEKVRRFQEYEKGCMQESADDRETHEWLLKKGLEFDRAISLTILELAEREGMIAKTGIRPHPNK